MVAMQSGSDTVLTNIPMGVRYVHTKSACRAQTIIFYLAGNERFYIVNGSTNARPQGTYRMA